MVRILYYSWEKPDGSKGEGNYTFEQHWEFKTIDEFMALKNQLMVEQGLSNLIIKNVITFGK